MSRPIFLRHAQGVCLLPPSLLAAGILAAISVGAQTPATLIDLGPSAPTPDASDIYQFQNGATDMPDGLNYYDDDGVNHPTVGEPGQTFTTPASGVTLNSVALQTGGGNPSGVGTAQSYLLHIYSVSNATATVIATYTANNFSFTDGDWLQWSGLGLLLQSNATYAYSFGRASTGTGWEALQKAGGNPYAGGEIGLIPPAGGAITFGSSASFDATFDLGLSPLGAPVTTLPVAAPSNTVYAGTAIMLAEAAAGQAPLSYQWLSNGIAIARATNSSLVVATPAAATVGYSVVVANSLGTSTSAVLTVTINPASAPFFTQQPKPASQTVYAGGVATISASVNGSFPIALQWQHNGANIPGATASGLSLANAQSSSAGSYALVASNSLGAVTSAFSILNVLPSPAAPPSVLTYHYDNTRDGANTNEYLLTPANVNTNNFGRLFAYTVDGHIYGEPLYVPGLVIPGQGPLNVVFAATQHDSVYALNADTNTGPNGGVIWWTNLGVSAATPNNNFGNRYGAYHDIDPEVGVTSTPVIDPVSGTIYLDVFTHEGTAYLHRIHALNITNGTERSFSPVVVARSVPGRGVASSGGTLPFVAAQSLQRPALTLAGGMLYVAYSGFADTDPYHGWVLGFNATNLAQPAGYVFNTTPNATTAVFGGNAGEGGLWMGGNGLSVDANTNLYFEVGNGSFSANTNGGDFADSFIKLSTTNGLAVKDYFTPYNQASLAAGDTDLGSGGPLLLPDSIGSATHPHLIIGAGKEGKIYLVDRDNLGHYNVNNDNQIIQELPGAIGGVWSSPAYWNHLVYYQGSGDVMRAFAITNALFNPNLITSSGDSFGFPGATPVVSASGTSNGIAWDIQADAYGSGPAILHAYNATNLSQELYNSSQILSRDNPGVAVKMTTPTVVNGKVYVGAEFALSVYGQGLFVATPSISPPGDIFSGSVLVTLADTTPGASIYYTLDGSTPSTNSTPYTGPFLLSKNTVVHAMAAAPAAVPSGVAIASFVNSASIGKGTGLQGQYYANHTSAQNFSGAPTLVRTDPTINFNWGAVGPDPSIGQTVYTVRWTGCVQPQFSETYTFSVTADDGVRLFVNNQELVNAWVDEAATTYTASVPLVAQQLYNIEMDYYQNGGGAIAQLAWSSPSTPSEIIPETQLYPYTNPPPSVVITSPTNLAAYTASASVTLSADADAPYNPLSYVSFYAGKTLLGSVSNAPYTLTATGLAVNAYNLTAVAVDGSGLVTTSAPVAMTVGAGSGLPYGLGSRHVAPAFFNMPTTFDGALPLTLSATGVFTNTTAMAPSPSLIPYAPIVPLWSDGAVKTRYFAVPYNGGLETVDQQIGFATNGEWTFPSGTVFVKTFQLLTNESDPNSLRRLETRLLVRDTNGAVYGVTYKWRPDNSDADLLTTSLTEPIPITTPQGVVTQNWYYPSPADCLTCHTLAANYVLGVKTRQLNASFAYPSGVTDNELRALNRAGFFNPAFNEAAIPSFPQLSSLTNSGATLVDRARSYLDANCAQCHRPGGNGPTFDARYDTPLAAQNIINAPVLGNLGYDHAAVVVPNDVWRSVLYDRMNTVDPTIKMPPLARNLIDTNAVAVVAAWINSLGGVPALAPPVISPAGGLFTNAITVTLQPPDNVAALYYTLDGTLPTTNSALYGAPFAVNSSALVKANAFEAGYVNSVAATANFTIVPPLNNLFAPVFLDGQFQLQYWAPTGPTYLLQETTDFVHWTTVSTNAPTATPFYLTDPGASDSAYRFYRAVQQ